MYLGHGTFASVALRIMEDFGQKTRMNGYTLPQTLDKVLWRHQSIASFTESEPAYIWWRLGIDEWGETTPIVDYGKNRHSDRNAYNWAKEVADHDGVWKLVLGDDESAFVDTTKLMVEHGLNFGPRYLTRVMGWFSAPSYYDSDVDQYQSKSSLPNLRGW